MKRLFLLTKVLLVTALLGVGVNVWADCSVTTDSYGKTKVVWDFGIEAKDGNATYYLDAATSAYVESTAYPSAANQRGKYMVAQINVHSSRSIKSNDTPDSDKGAGVILGSSQGYITIYAPVSGTLSLTGKYLSNITVTDKSDSDKKLTTNGSSVKVKQGHRIQLTANNGCGVATMTLTPDDYDTDVVASGNWNFANAEVIRPSYDIAGTNIISTMGYKTSADKTSKDVFIVAANSGGSVRIHPNEEAAGLKLGSGAEFDFTPTNAGWLTINYSYGGDRGTWYIKDGSTNTSFTGTKTSSQVKVYLAAGYRAQFVTGTGSNTSVLITSVTFTGNVSVTVSSAGYATYVNNDYDLDFSATDIKAYKAQVNTTTGVITLDKVDNVPAGTPVILYKDGGATESIPVMTGAAAVSGNDLKAGKDVGVPTEDGAGNYNYVLDKQDEIIGFYKAADLTVPTNRAYLQTTYNVAGIGGGSEARGLRMVFAGDITGINEAAPTVEAAQKKGKFIKDGKLFILKNGKKYNANGIEIK